MRWLDGLRERCRALFAKRREERELDEELRFHLERATERNLGRGMAPADAARAARLGLGGVESVKERVRAERGTRWLEDLGKDLAFGLRALHRSPAFSATAVVTLALGIGANAAMFSVVDAVLLRPLPFPSADRLVAIWTTIPERGVDRSVCSPHDVDDWRASNHTFADLTAFGVRSAKLSGGEHPEMVRQAQVVPGFFRTVGLQPVLGRGFLDAERDPDRIRVAVISHALWQSRFGGAEEVLGETLRLDDEPLEIVGVAPERFGLPSDDTAVWTPLPRPLPDVARSSYWAFAFGRLKPGTTREQAAADLGAIMERLATTHPENRGLGVRLEGLLDVVVGDVRPTLRLLWATVAFLLLIACANVAHLLLARAAGRRREIAVRASLGAGRGRVVRQLLAESLVLALAGGALGLALAGALVEVLPKLAADTLPRIDEVALDARAFGFGLAVSLVTGLLFGTLPALRATRAGLGAALAGGGRRGSGDVSGRWQGAIVVGETAAALVLLVGAALLLRSFGALLAIDPGFRPDRLLSVRLSPVKEAQFDGDAEAYRAAYEPERERVRAFYRRLREQIAALPDVEAVGLINHRPLAGSAWGVRILLEGNEELEPTQQPTAASRVVEPGYFRTVGIPLIAGRDFSGSDHGADGGVVIVSREAARMLWGGRDPLGRRLSFRDGQWVRVVGVVGDVHDRSLEAAAKPTLYSPFAGATYGFHGAWTMEVMVRTAGDPAALIDAVRAEIAAVDPDLPVAGVSILSEEVYRSTAARRFATTLLGGFGLLALALAVVGLYGVLAYAVAQRLHELGIRLALGATRGDLFGLVVRRGMLLVAGGTSLGLAAAWALSRLIGSQLYEVQPTDGPSYLAAALLLSLVALVACLLPARRATRLDPGTALRCE